MPCRRDMTNYLRGGLRKEKEANKNDYEPIRAVTEKSSWYKMNIRTYSICTEHFNILRIVRSCKGS